MAVSFDLITFVQYASYAAVGGFLAIRRPRNAIGWLLIGLAVGFIGTTTPPWVDIEALQAGTASLDDFVRAWLGTWAGGASFLLYAALALTFPSGHLPQGRWRRPIFGALVLGAMIVAIPAFLPTLTVSRDGFTSVAFPNRIGFLPDVRPDDLPVAQLIVTLVPIALFAIAVVSLVRRYRQAVGILRLQIRWLLAAVAFVVVSVVGGLTLFVLSGNTAGYAWIPAIVAYPTVPIAVGVAVTRYRLFEIDRIISRTISYLGVSAILFAVFAVVTLTIGTAIGDNPLTVAVSTLVVAALFNPLRIRMQRAVDRRFNRSRVDQERALEAFTAGLRDEVDVERLLGHVRAAVTDAVEPTTIAIWRREPGTQR